MRFTLGLATICAIVFVLPAAAHHSQESQEHSGSAAVNAPAAAPGSDTARMPKRGIKGR